MCIPPWAVSEVTPHDGSFEARIDIVDVEETLAAVMVLEESWGGSIDFTDYLLPVIVMIILIACIFAYRAHRGR